MPTLSGKSRLVVAVLGCLVAAGYCLAASKLRMPVFSDPVGPRLVPYLIGVAMVLSSVFLVVEHLALDRRAGADTHTADKMKLSAVIAVGLLLGYYLVFEWLGFILASQAFLLAFLSYSHRGHWMTNILVALIFPMAAYLLLAVALGARLPVGVLLVG